MAEFKYSKNESLKWDCNNCIVFENGEVKNSNDLDGVEITKVNNYCLNKILFEEFPDYLKYYDKNILCNDNIKMNEEEVDYLIKLFSNEHITHIYCVEMN